jgi:predicted XRE-type DNA-binding protein
MVLAHEPDTEDRDERRIKAELAERIALVIEVRGNSDSALAKITGLEPGEASRIADGAVEDYSVWQLMKLLAVVGNDIAI